MSAWVFVQREEEEKETFATEAATAEKEDLIDCFSFLLFSNRGVTIWSAEKKRERQRTVFLTAQMRTMEAITEREILRRFEQKAKESEKVIFLLETCPIFFLPFSRVFSLTQICQTAVCENRKSNYGFHCPAVKSSPTFRRGENRDMFFILRMYVILRCAYYTCDRHVISFIET